MPSGLRALPDPRPCPQAAPVRAELTGLSSNHLLPHRPALPVHLGEQKTLGNFANLPPPTHSPALRFKRRPRQSRRPGRVCAPCPFPGISLPPRRRSTRGSPVTVPAAQMRVSRAGSPDPGRRTLLSPPPARRPSRPGSPAGAALPARGTRQPSRAASWPFTAACPPALGIPRRSPATFAPLPERSRTATREIRFVHVGRLLRAGSLRSAPGWEAAGCGAAGSFSAENGQKEIFKFCRVVCLFFWVERWN